MTTKFEIKKLETWLSQYGLLYTLYFDILNRLRVDDECDRQTTDTQNGL